MFYIGSHWGHEKDGYVCSSTWMRNTYNRHPQDFKRRIVKRVYTNRVDLLIEEERWLSMIKDCEMIKGNKTSESRKNVRYYNISKAIKNPWHQHPEKVKTIGQKISAAKKGKSTGPCSPEKAQKISEAKKAAFAERGGISEKHRQALKEASRKPHTEEWKQETSKRLKEQWANGTRKAKESLTEEHKQKISQSQKGKKLSPEQVEMLRTNNSKLFNITYSNGHTITVSGLKQFGKDSNIPYVTLHKSSILDRPIKKYDILKIQAA